jgi:hypothetical protein
VRKNVTMSSQVAAAILAAVWLMGGTAQALQAASDDARAGNNTVNESKDTPGGTGGQASGSGDATDWTVAIYPVLAWAPVFGASVSFPEGPSLPDGGSPITGSGTTNTSFNGAAFFGLSVQERKWIIDFGALWAGLSADRTSPHVYISTHAVYGELLAGRQVYRHISLTGGVRRMALNIHAQLGNLPEEHWKPGVWDPLVGLDWRQALGRKWAVRLDLAGGGFGVGNDVDISGSSRADWRFTHRFGLTLGYGALHFEDTQTVSNRVHKTKQTLNGPIFGFGIYI